MFKLELNLNDALVYKTANKNKMGSYYR